MLAFSSYSYSEQNANAVIQIQKERAIIEKQIKDLDKEYIIRKELLGDAIERLDEREKIYRGGCPNPPCKIFR